jgi:hypothetical protein
VAELRRRFGLDEPDDMVCLKHNGTTAWIGLPDREASKIQDLWDRDELGIELSVEVRAPVVVGVYPMRIARYVMDNGASGANGHAAANGNGNGSARHDNGSAPHDNGAGERHRPPWHRRPRQEHPRDLHAPRPMNGAPSYGSAPELPPD